MMATQTDTKAGIRIITLGGQKTTVAPSSTRRKGGGGGGCSEEPELRYHQNIEVRELQVAGRLKYFLPAWKAITSDSTILDMVQHCHLAFITIPYQQHPMPPMRFNSNEAAIIDGEIQQLLCKGVLEETTPSYGQYISTIFLRKKEKLLLQINLESERTE